ncbi:MAG: VTT domain-containing protein [Vicinamibacterales bacterium]
MTLLLLLVWSFAAATILPLSSEVPLALVVRSREAWLLPVLIATLGNYLGACTTYLLARAVRERVAPASSGRAAIATDWINRYGGPVLVLSWVPILGDAMVAAAGAVRMPFLAFSLWCLLGKAARYLAVAWLVLR